MGRAPQARKPITAHGAHRYYRILKTFFNWLPEKVGRYLDGWVNPMQGIRRPKRVLDAARQGRTGPRDAAIVLVMADKGLRAGKLLGLTLADWAWATGTLTIRRAKGGKFRQVILRYVFRGCPNASSQALSLTQDGRPLTYAGLKMVFRQLEAGTGLNLYPHRLRHTFALHWVTAGGSLHELQALLGHASPAMSLHDGRMVSEQVEAERQARFSPMAGLGDGKEGRRRGRTRRKV